MLDQDETTEIKVNHPNISETKTTKESIQLLKLPQAGKRAGGAGNFIKTTPPTQWLPQSKTELTIINRKEERVKQTKQHAKASPK